VLVQKRTIDTKSSCPKAKPLENYYATLKKSIDGSETSDKYTKVNKNIRIVFKVKASEKKSIQTVE
jgi:hypothetical protein